MVWDYGLDSIRQELDTVYLGLDTLVHDVVRFNVIETTQVCNYYPTQQKKQEPVSGCLLLKELLKKAKVRSIYVVKMVKGVVF